MERNLYRPLTIHLIEGEGEWELTCVEAGDE